MAIVEFFYGIWQIFRNKNVFREEFLLENNLFFSMESKRDFTWYKSSFTPLPVTAEIGNTFTPVAQIRPSDAESDLLRQDRSHPLYWLRLPVGLEAISALYAFNSALIL